MTHEPNQELSRRSKQQRKPQIATLREPRCTLLFTAKVCGLVRPCHVTDPPSCFLAREDADGCGQSPPENMFVLDFVQRSRKLHVS